MSLFCKPPNKAILKPRLLDQLRHVIRCKHYSIRTEQTYLEWIKRFIYFNDRKHPKDLGTTHISAFLTHLAVQRKVAGSTQNQALCALVFLYKEIIKKDIGQPDDLIRAKRPSKLSGTQYFKRKRLYQGRRRQKAGLALLRQTARQGDFPAWQHSCR
jgi:site-specific recombinase XerD